MRVLLCEWRRIVGQTKSIVTDEYLAVAMRSGADTDRRNFYARGDPPCKIRWNRFQNDGKHAGLLQHLGILDQAVGRLRVAALLAKTSELMDRLRRQTDVTHHRDTDIDETPGRVNNLPASFNLDGCGAALLNQPAPVTHCF